MERGWVTKFWGLRAEFKKMAKNKAEKTVWRICTVRMANSKTYRSLTGKGKQTQWGPGWSGQDPPHLSTCPALADCCCGKAAPVLLDLLIPPEKWKIWIFMWMLLLFLNVNKYVKLRKIPLHSLKRWCVCTTNLACEFAPSAGLELRQWKNTEREWSYLNSLNRAKYVLRLEGDKDQYCSLFWLLMTCK